jgi:hypothetical protein
METATIFIVLIFLIPLIYLLYFWANSDPLSDSEIKLLAQFKRFWDINNYYGFTNAVFTVDKQFKSALNSKGQLYNVNEDLNNFPSIASSILKGKKHEWVAFAFSKNQKVYSFYTNKGNDNQSVSVNLNVDVLKEIAREKGADTILEFHNHPNAVLHSSFQDSKSANYYGNEFTKEGINFLAFVCGRGNYLQYAWWLTDSFFSDTNYRDKIISNNGKTRSCNFEMRKELKRKNNFASAKLMGNTSNNVVIIKANAENESVSNSQGTISINRNCLEQVLELFNSNLKSYPLPNYSKVEDSETQVNDVTQFQKRYIYTLNQKELGIFDELEFIDHNENHKTFNYKTKSFNTQIAQQIVDKFYKIFGNDSLERGRFDENDSNAIRTTGFWVGRLWSSKDCHIMLSRLGEDDYFELMLKW